MANEISQDGFDNIVLQNIQESEIHIAKIYDSKYDEWVR